ncbi:DUF3597 domain-containing protein [Ramlibacter sp. Leaf400]|uniref:DUF3597 domain-containing protein n=1 Tax=Ramlibacter sp. Leaf400 TaxID=1736365 RepID=UPI0006FB443A|nr:DUF3597 domain-containing protein [Ramlibacter sp. Leaf400]KQT11187.1 hypothetical protein ASG30_04700 [Ramlibacter sp. Leaf400]
MSILGKIFGRIFPSARAAEKPQQPTTQTTPAGGAPGAPGAQGTPQQPAPGAAGAATANTAPVAAVERVDIEKVLDDMASKNQQKLNWRTSIVDLMKLVGMESSLQERKELADELGYTGDKSDSAKMNMWLHKEVMRRMEENGGKVPANLKD